jgi:hypothetical protein
MGRHALYKKEYNELLIERMREGRSAVQFCAEIGVSRDTFYEWAKKNKSFAAAYKLGRELCESYWEGVCGEAIHGRAGDKFNTGLFCFYMKNRFGWRDGREKEDASAPVVEDKRQTIDIKNLIILNANQSAEARERVIKELERIAN